MAGSVLEVIQSHGRIHQMATKNVKRGTIISSESYLYRLAVSNSGENPRVETVSEIAAEYAKRMVQVARMFDISMVKFTRPTSWWSASILSQPLSADPFTKLKPGCAREILLASAFPSSLPFSESEMRPRFGSAEMDSIEGMVITLSATDPSDAVIVIDWTDSSLLALLYLLVAEKGRRTLYLSGLVYPEKALSVKTIYDYIAISGEITSQVSWSNLLFLFPLLGCMGLPPAHMLQYYYKTDPLIDLGNIARTIPSPIYDPDQRCIDLEALAVALDQLAGLERERVTEITRTLKTRDDSAHSIGRICDLEDRGWEGFRTMYYDSLRTWGEAEQMKRAIWNRCISYLSGLMILVDLYSPHSSPRMKEWEETINIRDAPLMEDLAQTVHKLLSRHRYVSPPTNSVPLEKESTDQVTINLNRMTPYYYSPAFR